MHDGRHLALGIGRRVDRFTNHGNARHAHEQLVHSRLVVQRSRGVTDVGESHRDAVLTSSASARSYLSGCQNVQKVLDALLQVYRSYDKRRAPVRACNATLRLAVLGAVLAVIAGCGSSMSGPKVLGGGLSVPTGPEIGTGASCATAGAECAVAAVRLDLAYNGSSFPYISPVAVLVSPRGASIRVMPATAVATGVVWCGNRLCLAVGGTRTKITQVPTGALIPYHNGAFGLARSVPGAGFLLGPVSCPSRVVCWTTTAQHAVQGPLELVRFNAQTAQSHLVTPRPRRLDPVEGADYAPTSISCSAAADCTVFGTSLATGHEQALLTQIQQGRVLRSHALPGIAAVRAVTCPSAGSCVAVGTTGRIPSLHGVVAELATNGSIQTLSVPAARELTAVTCISVVECVAVGGTANGDGVLVRITPGAAVATTIRARGLMSVTCPSTTQCWVAGAEMIGNSVTASPKGLVTFTPFAP